MAARFIEHYTDLKQLKKTTNRDVVRKMALDMASLVFNASGTINNALQKPRVQFLYIHHIFKDEEALLRKLIDELAKDHVFIPYSEAVTRILNGAIDKPYISISSDDGLKNNLRAAEILTSYGISGCFFICPPMIGEKNYEAIKAFCNQRLHLPPVEFMRWEDIEILQRQGHEIGGHTMAHVNLATCSNSLLQTEIGNCHIEIAKRCGSARHFAYPYGRYHHFNYEASQIVFSSGFESCASAERGCHVASSNTLLSGQELFIRRDHVILSWPLRHILYFMARNALKSKYQQNTLPYHADSDINQ